MKTNKLMGYLSGLTIALFLCVGIAQATEHEYKCYPKYGLTEKATFPAGNPILVFKFNDTTRIIDVPSGNQITQLLFDKNTFFPKSFNLKHTYCRPHSLMPGSRKITNSYSMVRATPLEAPVPKEEIWNLTYQPDKYFGLAETKYTLSCQITTPEVADKKDDSSVPQQCALPINNDGNIQDEFAEEREEAAKKIKEERYHALLLFY